MPYCTNAIFALKECILKWRCKKVILTYRRLFDMGKLHKLFLKNIVLRMSYTIVRHMFLEIFESKRPDILMKKYKFRFSLTCTLDSVNPIRIANSSRINISG